MLSQAMSGSVVGSEASLVPSLVANVATGCEASAGGEPSVSVVDSDDFKLPFTSLLEEAGSTCASFAVGSGAV